MNVNYELCICKNLLSSVVILTIVVYNFILE
jgi:hypothetical protein